LPGWRCVFRKVMKCWSAGVLECWSAEVSEKVKHVLNFPQIFL